MDDPKQFYVTLFSTALQNVYKDNKHNAYIVELAQLIELDASDKWEVGVCEFRHPSPWHLYVTKISHGLIYVGIISPQYVNNQLVRCIRTFLHPVNFGYDVFDNSHYMLVEKRRFHTITRDYDLSSYLIVIYPLN